MDSTKIAALAMLMHPELADQIGEWAGDEADLEELLSEPDKALE